MLMTMHEDGTERVVPEGRWRAAFIMAAVLVVIATAGWEMHWRAKLYDPNPNNTYGLWAKQRREASRQDHPTVIIGSSRALFDINLDVWERVTGRRPIQLSLEGTSPRMFLTDLADDTSFVGTVIVGVTPPLFFFQEGGIRSDAIDYYKTESPAEWIGQQIGLMLEKRFAFMDEVDLPLFRLLEYIPMKNREGVFPPHMGVHQLSVLEEDRNTKMWRAIETDSTYQGIARNVWLGFLERSAARFDPDAPPFDPQPVFDAVKADVDKIRARGGDVVFIRCPSSGPWREMERNATPRERFWDALLAHVDAGGVHFEDHDALRNLDLPEWSHLSAASVETFIEAVAPLLLEALATRGPVKSVDIQAVDPTNQENGR